jgi:hypothetical protein
VTNGRAELLTKFHAMIERRAVAVDALAVPRSPGG